MPIHFVANDQTDAKHLWGIVLAGGQGKRLEQFIRSRFGTGIPKQYCAFYGTRSMVSNTISRIEQLVPRDHIVVTIQHDHLNYASDSISDIPEHNIVIQPMNRETGIGIIHTLLHIYYKDPQALVAIFPSDHFILEEERFMECVDNGVTFVKNHKEQLLILGIEPEQPEPEYGWIKPGKKTAIVNSSVINRVSYFWEKPSIKQALELYENKYLWNTMVVISSVHTMISRFYQLMPEIVSSLLSLREHFYTPFEYEETKAVYEKLPVVNFSYSILQNNIEELSVLRVKDVYWSDWGNPYRVEKDIAHLNQVSVEKFK